MFKLLRRSKSKKSKNKCAEVAPKNSASQQSNATEATAVGVTERYRQFSEIESEAGQPTVPRKTRIRAVIEELEDLHDLEEDNDEDEKQAATTATLGHDNRIYFERCEEEKVNLAKTAANFTPNVAPPSSSSAVFALTALSDRATVNSKSNSAAKANSKTAFGKFDVDRINNIVAATTLDEDHDVDGDDRDRNGPRTVSAPSKSSQNEQAEWQRHVSPIGHHRNKIDKCTGRSECSTNSSKQFNRSDQRPTVIIAEEDAARSVLATETRNSTATATATATADTVNNEVKYRNLGNSQTVKKNAEAKRQSRLSLALGLRSKSSVDTQQAPVKQVTQNSSEVRHAARKSFFSHKSGGVVDSSEREVIDSNEQQKRPNSKFFFKGDANPKKSVDASKKLRPLQKSREFFSDIFMARGRNHNRNRNQQQPQPQPQPQQLQQSQQSKQPQQQQQLQEPCKYAVVVGSSNQNNNNHSQIDPPAMSVHHDVNNVTNWLLQHSKHLGTISDPSSVSTNSYQMTMSNNSPKNFSQVSVDAEQQQQRSNSAEPVRAAPLSESGEQPTRTRSLSVERTAERAAGANKERALHEQRQESAALNRAVSDERHFIHAPNIERNGANTENFDEEEDHHQHSSRNVNQSKSNARETINEDGENRSRAQVDSEKPQFDELTTECVRDNVSSNAPNSNERVANRADNWSSASMGQTNAKSDTPSSTRSSTPRDFRESIITEERNSKDSDNPRVTVPTITVVDYSDGDGSGSSGDGSPTEKEVFYDFEGEMSAKINSAVNITAIDENSSEEDEDEDDDTEDEDVFHEQTPPAAVFQQKWTPSAALHSQVRRSPTKLENVPEQEEEEEEEEDEEEAEDAGTDERNLDNELERHRFGKHERSPLKSANTSDSNLSSSFPDSGIGDSQASSASKHPPGDSETSAYARSATIGHSSLTTHQRVPFVRDGYSTDCGDYDDLDYVAEESSGQQLNERLVCIESISLPDVVVESTTASSSSNTSASAAGAAAASSAGDHIININGATGNSLGNVHFIPIHVEGGDNGQPKRRSVDDSVIGGNKSFSHMNGHHPKTTIEIIEDSSEADIKRTNGYSSDIATAEKLKRELTEQKSRFGVQLEDAQKNVHNLQTKVFEMQAKIEKLEQELSAKAWNVERLQGELSAAHKDDEYVRKKLKLLEDEKTNLRHRYSDNEDEFKKKFEELETQYKELEERYNQTKHLASNLQTQLAAAQSEAEEWRLEVDKIRTELEEQISILKNALENSEAERKICQDKWQKEFEMLRNQNQDREESLMTDCEWQLRQMQKQCKDKFDKSEHGRRVALEKAEELENELEERQREVDDLKVYQAEVKSLRGVVTDQENSIQTLMEQIESLKADLQAANENLEEQIEAVKKIKYQCDNAIYDKERQMIYRIDEVRNEAAAFWETKLYTEMTRLKNELESVYVDERREALDKLQAEHIEELRALTTRYTANEEELRVELAELQESFDNKNEEFLELRDKSDNALMQTRMHLDRADREYQNAMCREEERREALEESLRKEFEDEKLEMEEKFRERLGQVKNEFAKELQITSQEMAVEHKKEMEKQKAKLHSEKDAAMQELAERHRKKLADAEEQKKDIELRQQRDLQDLKAAYDAEKAALDKRDMSNANEIEQLHRKCRCLTNLFEEMRMRYERRDPRAEDLREISELRSRCESQERDLYLLTDRLREMQIQMTELQQNGENSNGPVKKSGQQCKKPPPKTIPTNCDVIYEENEERDSPPPPASTTNHSDDDDDEEEADEDDEEEAENEDTVNEDDAIIKLHGKISSKKIDNINEDETHMITAM